VKNTSEKYEYNAYTTAHLDKLYHPTSSIFEENKKEIDNNDINNNQPGGNEICHT
jgi:hypothetical protein